MYNVEFTSNAKKFLSKANPSTAKLILSWIKKNLVNCTDPRAHGKALTANRSGQWRYRVGDYRLLCEIHDDKVLILVVEIGHRKNIYK